MKKLLALGRQLFGKAVDLSSRLQPILKTIEPAINAVLYFFSLTAIALVCINEFVPHEQFVVPLVNMHWSHFLMVMQATIWAAYMLDFILYGLASGKPLKYARSHLVELVICIAWVWVPFGGGVLIQQLQSVMSLQTLILIGMVAHVIRLARGLAVRFSHNPWVVLLMAFLIMITASATILMRVEPQTFRSFQDAAWYVGMVSFTVGTPLSPATLAGRIVAGIVVAFGVSLGAIFSGAIGVALSRYLFEEGHSLERISKLASAIYDRLSAVFEIVQQLPAGMQKINELVAATADNKRLLNELTQQREIESKRNQRILELLEKLAADKEPPVAAPTPLQGTPPEVPQMSQSDNEQAP